MASAPHGGQVDGWLEKSGLPHIFRVLGMAVHPAKLGVALAAIFLTFAFGGLLDVVWPGGVSADAIDRFILARQTNVGYEPADGEQGVFGVWIAHERRCVQGLLGSSVPGVSLAAETPVGRFVEAHARYQPIRNFASMIDGVIWLVQEHFLFFVIFGLGALLIWSLAGGAICRIAAVEFARDEKLTMKQAVVYAWERLFSGFFLAPCIPLILAALTALLLIIGGLLLRIWLVGDIIGGLLFFLAIIGGFIIALLLVGLAVGGSLFWPAVATESSDAFDAFQRGVSYPLTKAWKAIWYAVVMVVFAGVCWLVVNLFTYFGLATARYCVAIGTAPFGWFSRGDGEHPISKMELLWPMVGPHKLYGWPEWSSLSWNEYVSAVLIGLSVLVVIGLMWSFLAAFYFSGSTVIYFLLRRDIDGTDLEELFLEDELATSATSTGSSKPAAAPSELRNTASPSAPGGSAPPKPD
jgi:hypothetical protein